MSAQDENDNSHHNAEQKTVKNIDWKCRYCSYTNNEEVSWVVFGDYFVDYDDGQEGAHICASSVANIVLGAKRIQEVTRQGGSNSCCTF